jgi:drug/metabolite transporter (DMT)-like permease
MVPEEAHRSRVAAHLGVLLAILFWGISFVATKAVVSEISPSTIIFSRAGLGTILLFGLLALRRGAVLPPPDAWRMLALMGFVGVAFHQLLQAVALTMTTAASTGWLIAVTPIWSAVLAMLMLKERLSGMKVAGLMVGLVGALVVMTRGHLDLSRFALPATRGDLLILASTVNWALYSVLGHRTIRRVGPARATAASMLCGWLLLAPLFVVNAGWRDYSRLSPTGWAALLFLGLFCSGLGYLFWYGALERLEATRVAAFLYLEPLVTMAAAVALLHERVGWMTILGGLLLLGGVVLVQRAPVASPVAGDAVATEVAIGE